MASTKLSRTPSSGDNQKYTVSCWVKRTGLGASTTVYSTGDTTANNNGRMLFIDANDKIEISYYNAGYTYEVTTNRVLRDTNAWYHIVVAFDSTQATASDRIKIWVNGEQETSFETSSYPSLNASFNFGSATHYIGDLGGRSIYSDFVLSHLHYIDGTAYDASYFGSTDITTGIWKPKTAPSVTYGTNGVFLKFENSGSMGTDSSGNANNFTVNGTLTQTVDTPSNVYTTLNALTEKSKPTLSNGNLKCGSSSDGQAVYSTLPMTNGYYEMKLGTAPVGGDGTGIKFGVHNAGYGFNGWNFNHSRFFRTNIGYNTRYSVADWGQGNSWENADTGVSSAINDIIMVAWKDGYLYAGKNGTWFFSADPSAGTATTLVPLPTPTNPEWFTIVASDLSGMGNLTFNFGGGYFGTTAVTSNSGAGYQDANGEGIFEYQVPTGCYAINTKNINAQEYS